MLKQLEQLESSEEFKKFKKEHPKTFLCSAFLILGKEDEKKQEFNYYISDKEIMSFNLGKKIFSAKLSMQNPEKLHALKLEDIKIEEDKVLEIIEREKGRKYDKTIAVLQELNGKLIWNLTCIDGFTLHRFHLNAKTGKFEEMADIKLQDMIRTEKKTPDYVQ